MTSKKDKKIQTTEQIQQQARSIYKDTERHPGQRLDEALQVLSQLNLADTDNHETLGLAGAIYKRKWQYSGQVQFLDQALAFYRKGHQESGTELSDQGYNGINAAFLLDMKASLLQKDKALHLNNQTEVADLIEEARAIRQALIAGLKDSVIDLAAPELEANAEESEEGADNAVTRELTKEQISDQWWTLMTLAEALFGLQEFALSGQLFQQSEALQDKVEEWQKESTGRQLAQLFNLQSSLIADYDRSEAKAVIEAFLGSDTALESMLNGKIGLALSGGGFRAAFYHVGMLARLAEQDVLRKVEVLSCVSGGSIVGAYYYMKVRRLLMDKSQAKVGKADYIRIVQEIERELLEAVQQNISTQVFTDFSSTWKMIRSGDYSRTDRLAELFDSHLYDQFKDRGNDFSLSLSKQKIFPVGEDKNNFSPRRDNWRLTAKAPIMVLNAANLNTGNNWQFTTSKMGEAPWGLEPEINRNDHLNWFSYDQARDEKYRNYPLDKAVAASSCVPGIFEPMAMPDLYAGHTVQLVDGGIYDDQGTAALLDEGCDILLISDACGQISTENAPSVSPVASTLRSNDILQARLRTAQYKELEAKRDSGLIKDLMFIHLKQGIAAKEVHVNGEIKLKETGQPDYDIPQEYQQALAGMRTDLDSFTDTEAYALMYSGYQMTAYNLPEQLKTDDSEQDDHDNTQWRFTEIARELTNSQADNSPGSPGLKQQLENGRHRFFKAFRFSGKLKTVAAISALYVLVLMAVTVPTLYHLALLALVLIVVTFVAGGKQKRSVCGIASGILALIPGWLIAKLHLKVVDPIFLKAGERRKG